MKSILYLSIGGDRPCKPLVIEHDPLIPAFEHFKHHDPRYTGTLYSWRYCCTIESEMGIHEKINRRAEHIGKTAWHYPHWQATPPDWKDRRRIGPDYQWYSTPEHIARSRFRKAKRNRDTRKGYPGYACIDLSFGLYQGVNYCHLNQTERAHLQRRLHLAATSRAPLPPWSLNDCYTQAAA